MNANDTLSVMNGLQKSGITKLFHLELEYANFSEPSIDILCEVLGRQTNLRLLYLRHVKGRHKYKDGV